MRRLETLNEGHNNWVVPGTPKKWIKYSLGERGSQLRLSTAEKFSFTGWELCPKRGMKTLRDIVLRLACRGPVRILTDGILLFCD